MARLNDLYHVAVTSLHGGSRTVRSMVLVGALLAALVAGVAIRTTLAAPTPIEASSGSIETAGPSELLSSEARPSGSVAEPASTIVVDHFHVITPSDLGDSVVTNVDKVGKSDVTCPGKDPCGP